MSDPLVSFLADETAAKLLGDMPIIVVLALERRCPFSHKLV